MKIVFTHTDFRIYWPARLNTVTLFLNQKGIDMEIIEIAGAGSHYAFAGINNSRPANWHCLFPEMKIEEIPYAYANEMMRRELDKIFPDIVFAGAIAFPSGAAAVRWAVDNKKKVVIFDDARLIDIPRSLLVNFVKRKIYSCVDAIFCPSPSFNETSKFFGFDDKQIFHGVTCVDNSFWMEGETTLKELLPVRYFLTVGRQITKKNLQFLLRAYYNYTKLTSDPKHIVLVGEGPEHMKLEDFVKNNHLETVHFLPFLSQEELKGVYRHSICFVMPSLYGETWGLTVNEAMASGLPVLVSNQIGCASTLVKEDINGYTFSPDNLEELTEFLLRFHNLTESEIAQMGHNSTRIVGEWGHERFCKGVYDAIQYVSSRQTRKAGLLPRFFLKIWKGRYNPL